MPGFLARLLGGKGPRPARSGARSPAEPFAIEEPRAAGPAQSPRPAGRPGDPFVPLARALGLDPLAVRALDAELRSTAQRVASAYWIEPGS